LLDLTDLGAFLDFGDLGDLLDFIKRSLCV
jgi:hypothetical protein